MEDIKDRLTNYKYNFFTNLQNYLGNELIFYGSIKRYDYFDKSSDIDITVITDNIKSTMSKLKNYLKIDKEKIKKIFQKFKKNENTIITGYKIKYENKEKNLVFDILIYDEMYRKDIMNNINEINNLPKYIVFLLCIIKYLYYTLNLLSHNTFLDIKNFIFNCYFNNMINFNKRNMMTTIILEE
jgi:predicted nucleotidyltransferase